jgi:hypothetical protein
MPAKAVNVPLNNLVDLAMESQRQKVEFQDLLDAIFALGLLYYTYDKEDKENIIKKIKEIRGIKEAN